MRAIVHERYGGPEALRCVERPEPVPADDELLVAVVAAGVNPYDTHSLTGIPYLMRIGTGLRRPKDARLGVDFVGRVLAVGSAVSGYAVGDRVFGGARGAFAERACPKADAVCKVPEGVHDLEVAGLTIGCVTALQGLRLGGGVREGTRVLINGASGGVGTVAVQIAKAQGGIVTGICSTRNLELVRSLGADRVIDYTRADPYADPMRYDLFLDCIGDRPIAARRRMLVPGGEYVAVGGPSGGIAGPLGQILWMTVTAPFRRERMRMVMARRSPEDLAIASALVAAGKLRTVVDRRFPLERAAEAFAYAMQGHVRGKVVLEMDAAA